MFSRMLVALAAGSLLAGCAGETNQSTQPATMPDDACGASHVQGFEGRKLDDDLRARIGEQSDAETIRIMRPGHAYTMDYRVGRLSVRIDEDGRITALNCG